MTATATLAPTGSRTIAVIAADLAGLLLANLVLYALGRTLGGAFTYPHNGAVVVVDPAAIAILSLAPLATGLVVVALLSGFWSAAVRVARIVAPALAVLTIVVMTIPAGFDTTSTVCLAAMHLAVVPAALLALTAVARWTPRGRPR